MALFLTYLVVASMIAFFTVKIIGIPIGKRMFTKIVLSILAFVPVYLLIAYLLSRFVSRDLLRLERSIRDIPYPRELPRSWVREVDRLSEVIGDQSRRIKEIIEAQRLAIYRLAHDLRTPVANLRNILTGIKEGVVGKDYLERAVEQADRISSLLEEALSQIRKTSKVREKEEVDLCGFLRSLERLWSLRFREKGLELKVECVSSIKLSISPIDLEEIMNNLIENSFKVTEKGGVLVRAWEEEGKVLILVEDTGGGMERGRLAEAYRKGSLGLYIVRELVWRNGGDVRIESSKRGTRVVVTIPLS